MAAMGSESHGPHIETGKQPQLVARSDRSQLLDDENFEADEINKRLLRKIDIRLCTIAGILCSLNLLDSGILSSAAVTSMREDIG